MSFNILVGSYTNDVATLTFDPSARTLSETSSVEVGFHPSWVTAYPGDKSLVFTCLEQSRGAIVALKYDAHGKGNIVATTPSGGEWPCAMLATKDQLFIANYGSGHVSALAISAEAPYFLNEPPTTLAHFEGKGPNEVRQQSAHPHQIYFIEERQEIIVPDLGGDRVYRFKKDATGSWAVFDETSHAPGSGARHVAFYDGVLYTVLELGNRLVAQRLADFPAKSSLISNDASASRIIDGMMVSAIFIPKPNSRFATPYIYLSNRDENHPEGDTIAVFAIQEGGAPKLVNEVRTGTKHPRGMAFGGQDDKYLVVGGQYAGGIKVYERINDGKDLELVAHAEGALQATDFCWI